MDVVSKPRLVRSAWMHVRAAQVYQINIGPGDTVGVAVPVCVQDVDVDVLGQDA